jgi:hypothetical protein
MCRPDEAFGSISWVAVERPLVREQLTKVEQPPPRKFIQRMQVRRTRPKAAMMTVANDDVLAEIPTVTLPSRRSGNRAHL